VLYRPADLQTLHKQQERKSRAFKVTHHNHQTPEKRTGFNRPQPARNVFANQAAHPQLPDATADVPEALPKCETQQSKKNHEKICGGIINRKRLESQFKTRRAQRVHKTVQLRSLIPEPVVLVKISQPESISKLQQQRETT